MASPPDPSELSGVLLLDKPSGPTSFDAVRAVKRALRVKSAGHTGTLDPNASGLLPICIGDATRIATFITEGVKEYEATIRFGITTDTLDTEGTVTARREAGHLTRDAVESAVSALVGDHAQTAPMYSARKVGGRRLYELARQGIEVERPAHDITVEAATLLAWSPPDAIARIRCSKGTYIRSLAALLGDRLETGAHLHALRRTVSGAFQVTTAIPLPDFVTLAERDMAAARALLLSVEQALVSLPACPLDSRTAIGVAYGNPLPTGWKHDLAAGARVRLLDPEGRAIAVGEVLEGGAISLLRVLRPRSGKMQAS